MAPYVWIPIVVVLVVLLIFALVGQELAAQFDINQREKIPKKVEKGPK